MKNKNLNKKISAGSCRSGEVRFAYCHVFAQRKDKDGNDNGYGVCVIIPKDDAATVDLIRECIQDAKEEGKKTVWGGKVPGNLKTPLRDADAEEREGDEFKNCFFLNANCKRQPGVKVLEQGMMADALSEDDFYSGCWGAVTMHFYPFDSHGNRGIACGLNNLIKTRDDEKLSGGASAEEDFGDLETV